MWKNDITELSKHGMQIIEPLVSIVIVNFNGGETLIRCLKSIFDGKYKNMEIILVDNASSDESADLCERLFSKRRNFRLVRLNKNLGFARGNNVGIRFCRGKYIMFLNNDTLVEPEWLIRLVEVMESDKKIGIAQSKLLQLKNPKLFDSAGDFIDSFGLTFMRGWGEEDLGQYNQVEEIFSARGAAMIVRAELIKKIGVFDDSLMGSYEDIDLCWRARRAGYKVIYVPSSIVYHVGGMTIKKLDLPLRIFHETKNMLIVSIKNQNLAQLMCHPPLIPIVGAMFIDIIRRKSPDLFIARLKATLQTLLELKSIWQKRFRTRTQTPNIDLMLESGFMDISRYFLYSLKFGTKLASKAYFSFLMNRRYRTTKGKAEL